MEPQKFVDPATVPPGTLLQLDGSEKIAALTTSRRKSAILFDQNATRYDTEFHFNLKWKPAPAVKAPEFYLKNLSSTLDYISFRVGADPEIFMRSGDGSLLPAYRFLPDKHAKRVVYWDGFQAEFRANSCQCIQLFTHAMRARLKGLYQAMRRHDQDATFTHESVVEVDKRELEFGSNEQVALGCDPSLNVYGQRPGRAIDGRKLKIRFAGGHMHFGVRDRLRNSRFANFEIEGAIKTLDALLGVAMVSLAEGYDDPRRRQFYGRAGEFRLPRHGIEYRTLSNFWLVHPSLVQLVFGIGRAALKLGMQGMRSVVDASDEEVCDAINNTDAAAARKILLRNEPLWIKLLRTEFKDCHASVATSTWHVLLHGLGVTQMDPSAIEANWRLKYRPVLHYTTFDWSNFVTRQ